MIESNETFSRKFTDYLSNWGFFKTVFYRSSVSFLKRYPNLLVFVIEKMYSIAEKYEFKVFEHLLKKNAVVFDIGANIGIYTFRAAKILKEGGKVYAFEPEAYNYSILESRIKKGKFRNVKAERLALSDKAGAKKLFIDKANPGNHSFSSKSLYYGNKFQVVTTTTIDSYIKANKIKKIDVIVMDVQGAESRVLTGGRKLLKNGKAVILMEYWPQGIFNLGDNPFELIKKLDSYGYKIRVVDKQKKRLIPIDSKELCLQAETWLNSAKYTNLLLTKES